MIFLSKAAVRYAIDVCQELDNRRIAIAIQTVDKRNEIRELMLDTLLNHERVERIINSRNNFEILFDNNSIIRFIHPSDSARGNRVHLMIVDKDIPIDPIQNVLKCCEILDWYEYRYNQSQDIEVK